MDALKGVGVAELRPIRRYFDLLVEVQAVLRVDHVAVRGVVKFARRRGLGRSEGTLAAAVLVGERCGLGGVVDVD